MPDTAFAAQMSAIAADRRQRERGRTGDGMAIVAPTFMDFGGERVAIEPDGLGRHALPEGLPSPRHIHTDCLEPVPGGVFISKRGDQTEVEEDGWVRCAMTQVRLHRHGSGLMAHWSRDRAACPTGVE